MSFGSKVDTSYYSCNNSIRFKDLFFLPHEMSKPYYFNWFKEQVLKLIPEYEELIDEGVLIAQDNTDWITMFGQSAAHRRYPTTHPSSQIESYLVEVPCHLNASASQ